MTKVIAPSSADVSLRPGEVLAVTMVSGGAGYSHPLPIRPATALRTLAAGINTFGPYMTDEKIRIYCSAGYLDYEYSRQSETSDVGAKDNPLTGNITKIAPVTQAQYDALSPADAETLYVIVEAA